MTATRLRAAAQKIRDTATEATEGRWTALGDYVWSPQDATVADCRRGADAEHFAMWSPPVALAVADWLDEEAERAEVFRSTAHRPAAVANLILRPGDVGHADPVEMYLQAVERMNPSAELRRRIDEVRAQQAAEALRRA